MGFTHFESWCHGISFPVCGSLQRMRVVNIETFGVPRSLDATAVARG